MSTENSATLFPTASQLATACKAIAYATKRIDESKAKLANMVEKKISLPSFIQALIDSGSINVKAKGEGQKNSLTERIARNEKRLSEKMVVLSSVGLSLETVLENSAELLAKS